MDVRAELETRFWKFVGPITKTGCRLWQGGVSNHHGKFHIRVPERGIVEGRKTVAAHLFSWWLANGGWEKFVDRTCSDTLCVAPAHLQVRTPKSRFWSKVDKTTTPNGCWTWKGGKHTFGYGSSTLGSAHRVAYKLTYGPIPEGAVIRHRCNNAVCCRPEHLVCGTQFENVQDALATGAFQGARGSRAGRAKFTTEQVIALREIYPMVDVSHQGNTLDLLARLLDVSPRTVWLIVKNRSYREEPAVDIVAVADLLAEYRKQGFPWHVVKDITIEGVIERVAKGHIVVDTTNTIKQVGYAGQRVCLAAHPHRFDARHNGQLSVVEAFNSDKVLGRALTYQLKRGDPATPRRVLRALQALIRAPRNFPPVLARYLSDTHVPAGGTVLDPCAGFGGRLLGTLASPKGLRYVGFDAEPQTVSGNLRLAEQLGVASRVHVYQQAVEDAIDWPTADVVLTSPPYYDREWYGEDAAAKLVPYPTYESWRDGFLRCLVEKALVAAPVLLVNVSAIKAAKEVTWDLPHDVEQLANEAGVRLARAFSWPLSAFGRKGREERILVFQR